MTEQANESTLAARIAELIRFGGVGATSAAIYFVLMAALPRFTTWPMVVRATAAYVPCMVVNYLLHRAFTFRSDKQHRRAGPRYVVVQGGGLLINSAVLWFGVDVAAWPYLIVQLAAFGVVAAWSYAGQKLWTFS